mgnify:FL=1
MEKLLSRLGYELRETSNMDGRWMIVSTITRFHWSFKTLSGVERFATDEKHMRQYANRILALNN